MKMILFDWNGTLLDDTQMWFEAVKLTFKTFGAKAPSIDQFFRELEGDYFAIYQSRGINVSREKLNQVYESFYENMVTQVELNQNVMSTIRELSSRALLLGVITAQLQNLVIPLLQKFELLSYFPISEFHVIDKSASINKLLTRHAVPSTECLYIGDTPSDVRAARKSGVKSVVMRNVSIPPDLIIASEPDYLIEDISELLKII